MKKYYGIKKSKMKLAVLICSMAIVLVGFPSVSLGWTGTVKEIAEGDLLVISVAGKTATIRLYGVATPERGQSFFENARVLVTHLANQKSVEVTPVYTDSDRVVNALVRLQGVAQCLNEQLVSYGMAWVRSDVCHARACSDWKKLEDAAKANMIGLWAEMNPVAPWEYKKQQRMKIQKQAAASTDDLQFLYPFFLSLWNPAKMPIIIDRDNRDSVQSRQMEGFGGTTTTITLSGMMAR
jgi:micrococcal nuclease